MKIEYINNFAKSEDKTYFLRCLESILHVNNLLEDEEIQGFRNTVALDILNLLGAYTEMLQDGTYKVRRIN